MWLLVDLGPLHVAVTLFEPADDEVADEGRAADLVTGHDRGFGFGVGWHPDREPDGDDE